MVEEPIIHVEGGTTNGNMIKFKKGAFASLYSVRPKAVKYNYVGVSPSSGVIDGLSHHILMMGVMYCTISMYEMPVFRPNQFFWENHQREGEEKWETYARVVR